MHLSAAMCCLPGLTQYAEGMHVQDLPDQMFLEALPCPLANKPDLWSWKRALGLGIVAAPSTRSVAWETGLQLEVTASEQLEPAALAFIKCQCVWQSARFKGGTAPSMIRTAVTSSP